MNHTKHLSIAGIITLVLGVITYFVLEAIYVLPEAASAEAVPIDALFQGHFILIAVLFAIVVGFMGYALYAFRRQEGDDGDGEFIHGNNMLEVAWTVLPIGLVLYFGVWGWNALDTIMEPKANERIVDVYGQQWNWSFHYDEYGEFANSPDLVLELNQPVLLNMEARDVIHSFWVPEFRVKQDLLPNRKTELRITPTIPGSYRVRCAEICGTLHSQMMADVLVLPPTEYAAWEEGIKAIASLPPEEYGQRVVWESNCKACHSVDGSAGTGPTWQGLLGREEVMADGSIVIADEEYIRNSICNPNDQIVEGYQPNVMPQNFCEGVLSDYDLDSVIAFIVYLSENGEPFPEQ
jgi:cytochrome c oxidase subunit 2